MKGIYKRPYQFRFTKPPKPLFKANLDNIAIVPASVLPFKAIFREKISKLPRGAVFLCYAKQNTRQRKLLERVETFFKQQGHVVTNLSIEQVL